MSTYILNDLPPPPTHARCVIEPFAGQGDLLQWLDQLNCWTGPIESYDIDPKKDGIIKRDTLLNPPNYENACIITNPYSKYFTDKHAEIKRYELSSPIICAVNGLQPKNACFGRS